MNRSITPRLSVSRFHLQLPILATALMVVGPLSAAITISPQAGYAITWDGNNGVHVGNPVPDNWALASRGAVASASSEYDPEDTLGYHQVENLNDGLYGNSKSWIGAPITGGESDDPQPIATIIFSREIEVRSFAFGRDNANSRTGTEPFTDRYIGEYRISVTVDGGGWWTPVGSIFLAEPATESYSGWLRHEFELRTSGGDMVPANGIRIQTIPTVILNGTEIAIDEIEVYGVPEPSAMVLIFALSAGLAIIQRRRSSASARVSP